MESMKSPWSFGGVNLESIWSIWTKSGVHMESIWSPSGVHMESMWSQYGVNMEPMWGLCGVYVESMESIWNCGGVSITDGSYWQAQWQDVQKGSEMTHILMDQKSMCSVVGG